MLVLAVDATTTRQSVALVREGQVLADVRLASKTALSRRLMPAIDFMLATLDIRPLEVDAYAVTTGPGSFTGVRVGLSTVQGLALAAGKVVIGLSGLDVLAARARGEGAPIVPLVESERGEVYAGVFDAMGQPTQPAGSWPRDAVIAALPGGALVVGDGAERHRAQIEATRTDVRFSARSSFLAATLGLLAEPRLQAGEGIPPRELRPLYLRGVHFYGSAPVATSEPLGKA